MNVLLLTHNRTVEEMISLAFREQESLQLNHGDDAGMVGGDYDVVIVDDTFPHLHEVWQMTQKSKIRNTVLLAQRGSLVEDPFDHRITKPFLPEEITSLMLRIQDEAASESSETALKKKKKKKKKKKSPGQKKFKAETEVLNLEEIETIKTLLEEEGLEIVHEEELAQKVLSDEESHNLTSANQEPDLLEALRTMKPKKIRKLLKGAQISIKIRFPGDGK